MVEERNESLSVKERVKEIFKKHGLTVAAIILSLSAVIDSIATSLKPGAKGDKGNPGKDGKSNAI